MSDATAPSSKDDELVEVSPKAIRIRKRWLDPHERKRQSRKLEAAQRRPERSFHYGQVPGFGWSIRNGTPVGLIRMAMNFAWLPCDALIALWITNASSTNDWPAE